MVKRGELVQELLRASFQEDRGTSHERFRHPDGRVMFVPRHREIEEPLASIILKEAGIPRRRS